jgi:hypothetical protein
MGAYVASLQQRAMQHLHAAKEALEREEAGAAELCDNPKQARRARRDGLAEQLLGYAYRMLDKLVAEGVCKAVAAAEPCLMASADELRDLWKDLNQLANDFPVPAGWRPQKDAGENASPVGAGGISLEEAFARRQWELIEELDRAIETEFFDAQRRLRWVLTRGHDLRSVLVATMRSAARRILLRVNQDIRQAHLRELLAAGGRGALSRALEEWLGAATPKLLSAGGAKRLFLAAPQGLDAAALKRELHQVSGDEAAVACDARGEATLCYEVEQLSLEGVEAAFLRRRPDCQELASRLHTRIDVDWSIV